MDFREPFCELAAADCNPIGKPASKRAELWGDENRIAHLAGLGDNHPKEINKHA
jgi:hypothetical protein